MNPTRKSIMWQGVEQGTSFCGKHFLTTILLPGCIDHPISISTILQVWIIGLNKSNSFGVSYLRPSHSKLKKFWCLWSKIFTGTYTPAAINCQLLAYQGVLTHQYSYTAGVSIAEVPMSENHNDQLKRELVMELTKTPQKPVVSKFKSCVFI